MHYILIIILAGYIDGGTSSSTAEFNDRAACDIAAKFIIDYIKSGDVLAYERRSRAICVPKATAPKDPE